MPTLTADDTKRIAALAKGLEERQIWNIAFERDDLLEVEEETGTDVDDLDDADAAEQMEAFAQTFGFDGMFDRVLGATGCDRKQLLEAAGLA